ncbi:MAG: D-glycero-beta-D-manno-heptose-7-phosphate kinase [Burkholderiaceae bacterium]|nr:D-glycero-beta-D-manno-heptose-7-phosphate kinase [Burkholderiaceae bacterium]
MYQEEVNNPLKQSSVLVVGDAMLDRYWFGDASRISPEAPVPVVRVTRTEDRLGGAANVARNAASLGARTSLLAMIGDDEAGNKLMNLLEVAHVRPCLSRMQGIATTLKLRILARNQQMLRTDFESIPDGLALDQHESRYASLLPDHEVVILSDYGKGGLERIASMIEQGRAFGRKILIDPKGDDYSKYKNASVITPNKSELAQVVGQWRNEDDLFNRAQNLRKELNLEKLLLTRSEEGMTLFDDDGAWTVPAQAREVFDVSGAGDTVIAILGVMLASGADWKTAVLCANRAGSIVVGKVGTATVTFEELFPNGYQF